MLKFKFTEDYKLFKKGTKISFYDEKKHAYTIIGLNESGKSLFLELLTDIFGNKKLDNNLSCEISYSMFIEGKEKIRKVIIKQGKFEYSEMKIDESDKVEDNVEVVLQNIYALLKECYQENSTIIDEALESNIIDSSENLKEISFDNMIFLYREFENNYGYYLFDIIYENQDKLLEDTSSLDYYRQQVKMFETILNNSSFYMPEVVNIDMTNKFEVINLIEGKTLKELETQFKNNTLMTNFIEIISEELVLFLDSDLHTSNIGKIKLEKKLEDIGNGFEKFYPNYSRTNFNLYGGVNQNIVINEKHNFIDYSVKSSGAKFWMNMYINLYEYYQSDEMSNFIILLDEPGYQLHLEAQEQFVKFLEEISEKNIVLWSTHSPSLINNNLNTNFFERKGEYVSITENYHNNFKENKSVVKHFLALTNNSKYSILDISNRVIIMVEGITDYYIFKKFFQDMNMEEKVYILPVGGIQYFIDYLPFLLNDYSNKMIIIYDEDKGKGSSKKSITKVKNIFNSSQLIEVKDSLENLYGLTEAEKKRFTSNKIGLSLEIISDIERFNMVKKNISDLRNENNILLEDLIYKMYGD